MLDLITKIEVGNFEIENYNTLALELQKALNDYENVVIIEDSNKLDEINKLKDIYIDLLQFNNQELINKALEDLNNALKNANVNYVLQDEHIIPNFVGIAEAKNKRALLNNASKSFNDKRIQLEKQYMQPFNVGKNQVKSLIEMIKETVESIDKQIKSLDTKQEEEKTKIIKKIFDKYNNGKYADKIIFDKIFDKKWLNKTCQLKSIEQDIKSFFSKLSDDIEAINSLCFESDNLKIIGFNEFFKNYSLNEAIISINNYNAELHKLAQEKILSNTELIKVYKIKIEVIGNKNELDKLFNTLKSLNVSYQKID